MGAVEVDKSVSDAVNRFDKELCDAYFMDSQVAELRDRVSLMNTAVSVTLTLDAPCYLQQYVVYKIVVDITVNSDATIDYSYVFHATTDCLNHTWQVRDQNLMVIAIIGKHLHRVIVNRYGTKELGLLALTNCFAKSITLEVDIKRSMFKGYMRELSLDYLANAYYLQSRNGQHDLQALIEHMDKDIFTDMRVYVNVRLSCTSDTGEIVAVLYKFFESTNLKSCLFKVSAIWGITVYMGDFEFVQKELSEIGLKLDSIDKFDLQICMLMKTRGSKELRDMFKDYFRKVKIVGV